MVVREQRSNPLKSHFGDPGIDLETYGIEFWDTKLVTDMSIVTDKILAFYFLKKE